MSDHDTTPEPDGSHAGTDRRRSEAIRTVAATAAALAAATVPVFLFGALSGAIGADLGFGEAGAGAAVTVFFLAAAIGAVPLGRVTDRIGARTAIRAGVVTSGLVCLGIAGFARSWWQIAGLLGVVGASIGLIDTGAARALTDRVRSGRQGFAFGIKEASVPLASMLAGAAVPLLGLRVGWRPTFAVAAVLTPIVWMVLPALPVPPRPVLVPAATASPARDTPAVLVVVAIGVAFGSAAANAAATLLVPALSAAGVALGTAGTLLATASIVAVAVRLGAGAAADRYGHSPLGGMAVAMALGAVGAIGLALADGPAAAAGAAMLLLGAGWGWTGLAFFAAMRIAPAAPAAAAGVVLSGLAIGGAGGPIVFGSAVARWSYPQAWALVAAGLAVGSITTAAARRSVARS